MFCSRCGNKLLDDAVFCGECGTPVNMQSVPMQSAPMQSTPMQSVSMQSAPMQPGSNMRGPVPGYGVPGMAQVPPKSPAGTMKKKKNMLAIVGIAGACLVVGIVIISLISSLLKRDDKDRELAREETASIESEDDYWEETEDIDYEDSVDEDADVLEESTDSGYEDNGEEDVSAADAGQEEADDGLAQAYIMDDIKIQMVRAATNVGFQNPDCWDSCQYDDFGNMISASGEKGKSWWRYDDRGMLKAMS